MGGGKGAVREDRDGSCLVHPKFCLIEKSCNKSSLYCYMLGLYYTNSCSRDVFLMWVIVEDSVRGAVIDAHVYYFVYINKDGLNSRSLTTNHGIMCRRVKNNIELCFPS